MDGRKFPAKYFISPFTIVCLVSFPVHILTQEISDSMWTHQDLFDDLIPFNAEDPSLTAKTTLQCAISCRVRQWCNSFFYNSVSKQCRLQRYVFMSLKDSTFNDTGSRYYRLKSESCPLEEGYVVDRVTSTCYRPVRKPNKSWVDARTACIADESDLVVLEPVEKLDFLYNLFVKNFNFYKNDNAWQLGGSRPQSAWGTTSFPGGVPDHVWVNGQPVDFTATAPYWKPGGPDDAAKNVIGIKNKHFYKLYNYKGGNNNANAYVCERPYVG